jgi:hypothetical protein
MKRMKRLGTLTITIKRRLSQVFRILAKNGLISGVFQPPPKLEMAQKVQPDCYFRRDFSLIITGIVHLK